MKYTMTDFEVQFPNDDACIEYLFRARYGSLKVCPTCEKKTNFFRIKKRKCYVCQFCGYQLHPLANTIFHKSDTGPRKWFRVIFLFSKSKNGVSAMEIQRLLGVTYKTAWRMGKQIRILFSKTRGKLSKIVESDDTYYGARKAGKRGRGAGGKSAIMGFVQRGGEVRAKIVPNLQGQNVIPIANENIEPGTKIITDDFAGYRYFKTEGFDHVTVNHAQKEYARGIAHTNTIEGFWSQLKRGINGTYHHVSPKYLQSYVDEFSYRYNLRNADDASFFPSMLSEVARQA